MVKQTLTAPLLHTERIINEKGTPSEYFMRQWETQRVLNTDNEALSIRVDTLEVEVDAIQLDITTIQNINLIAGTGLSGGGDLSGPDRTFNLEDTAVTPGTFGDANNVAQITVDQQGRITAAVDVPISGTGGGDQFFTDVVYLSGFEGTDGSTTFLDESNFGRALTAVGNAQVDTAQFKFGVSSALFDGVSDAITTPDAVALEVTNEDFTVEVFVRFSSLTASIQVMVQKYLATGDQREWFFRRNATDLEFGYYQNGTAGDLTSFLGTWNPVIDTWFHVAVSRNGADLRMFVDGTQVGSTNNVGTDTIFSGTAPARLGDLGIGVQELDGWLDEYRFTVGVGRYTANFTAPTAAFPRSASSALSVEDEGVVVEADTKIIDFVGDGVTVTGAGSNKVTVTVAGDDLLNTLKLISLGA